MIGKRLREARQKKEMTQKSLADELGIEGLGSASRIAGYEHDRNEPPVALTRAIAKILDVPEYYFYILDDNEAAQLLYRYHLINSNPDSKKTIIEDIQVLLNTLKTLS